ncbi:hypothetical protein FACS189475_09020 [Betaproteobacteria bacterium]|nr:hypothetical protein FACS189475_09020 [Betaproteobacteria bacterium]
MPKGRLYGRYLTHVWVWINTLSLRIPDSMCGFRIYPLAAVMPLLPVLARASRMDFDTEILVRLDWAAAPIVNLPVAVRYPVGGLSHFQPLRDNLRISAMHTRLFFGMLHRFPQLLARHWRGKEKTHWTEIREAGFVGGMRFLFWVYRRGGAWLFRAFLFVVMLWFFATRRLARRASLEYLRRLHRESGGATPAPTRRNSFRHFMNFADVILDKFLAFSGELENIPCHIEGRETLLSLAREKRGALLVTAHLGNLELCRRLHYSLPSDCPPPRLTVLTHTRHAESFNRMLRWLDPSHTFDLVQVTSLTPATAMLLSERIAAGGLVAIAGDRVPVAPGNATFATLEHPFLGAPAHFPIGPYVLAAALGCPVFMLFSARRDGDFFVGLRFLAERIVLPRRARRAAIVPYLSAYVAALTEECRKNPLQWFNFFPFWQAPEFPV